MIAPRSTVTMLALMLSKQTGATFTPLRVTAAGKERGFMLNVTRDDHHYTFFLARPLKRGDMESVLAGLGDMINMGFIRTEVKSSDRLTTFGDPAHPPKV